VRSDDRNALRETCQAFTGLFDDLPVAVETARAETEVAVLYPEERAYVASAQAGRQVEFATARSCARAALARLGFPPGPLVPAGDRSPTWPSGAVGSITHSQGLCAVAVARATVVRSIGIDIESSTPLDCELEQLICTPAERRWLDSQHSSDRGCWVGLVFSAKESLYKCLYPRSRTVLDFLDVEVCFDRSGAAFSARLVANGPPDIETARGRWTWIEGFVLTRAILR
jgi:4'-phosphopantetheinyl transferase EntD